MSYRRAPEVTASFEALLAGRGEAYLVGSANWGLADTPPDLDYVTRADPVSLGQETAEACGGRSVVLDRSRRYVRLVLPGRCPLDLAPLTGDSITADLARRDFTVNAIAAALPDRLPVIDPFRGRTDLRYRLVRQVSASGFRDDPLRVLRGVRLLAERRFSIEPRTLASMREHAPLLWRVHPERIHTELRRILTGVNWLAGADLLVELDTWPSLLVLPRLRPERECHRRHLRLIASGGAAVLASPFCRPGIPGTLGGVAARGVAVLASVLVASGVSMEMAEMVADSLCFTRAEASLLGSMCAAYEAAGRGASNGALVEDFGCGALWAALLRNDQALFARLLVLKPPARETLPGGRQLAERLDRAPGPWMRPVLRELRRAAIMGEVGSREEAFALAERLVARDIDIGEG